MLLAAVRAVAETVHARLCHGRQHGAIDYATPVQAVVPMNATIESMLSGMVLGGRLKQRQCLHGYPLLADARTDTAVGDAEFNDADAATAAQGGDLQCWSRWQLAQSTER